MQKRRKLIGLLLCCAAWGVGTARALPAGGAEGIPSVQQVGTCTGVVKDATGETIIGASVVVKGTTNGAITDLDGKFELKNVKPGDIISVSYVGYAAKEVTWEGQPLNIVLVED